MKKAAKNRSPIFRFECPVCGTVARVRAESASEADEIVSGESYGWRWSSQVSEPSTTWHLVCPDHYESERSRKILNHAENDPQPYPWWCSRACCSRPASISALAPDTGKIPSLHSEHRTIENGPSSSISAHGYSATMPSMISARVRIVLNRSIRGRGNLIGGT